MSTKHTPGPWVVAHDHPDEETRKSLAFIRPACANSYESETIADIYCCGGDAEREANARLIAAAPDLLEALRALMIEGGGSWGVSRTDRKAIAAHAAIAKATGEQA